MLLAPSTQPPIDVPAVAAELVTNLGTELLNTRMRRDLSIAEAAAQIGVGTDTLTKLEAGTSNPTRTTIVAALRWL